MGPLTAHHRARRLGVLLMAPALLLTSLASATPAAAETPAPGVEFVAAANVYRMGDNLRPVANLAALSSIATERANQMAHADKMAHDLDYVMLRLNKAGVCWTGVGEIIAFERGYPDHSYLRTVDQWWASQGHHDIIVGNYNGAIGAYALSASEATYSVMVFVNLCGAAAPSIVAPSLGSRSPAVEAIGVASGAAVQANFSEAVTGVNRYTFLLRDPAGTKVPASVSYDTGSRTATLVPGQRLADGRYRATLSSRIYDATGIPLPWTSWSFTVGDATISTAVVTTATRATFTAGTHTGYRFRSGAVAYSKSARLYSASGAPTSERRSINGRVYLFVTSGIWAGYWVPESRYAYIPGVVAKITYATARRLAFTASTITGYRYDSGGRVIGSRKVTLAHPSGASASARAIINGRPHFYVIDGVWAGYWVPDTAQVSQA
ncbi:MAG: Ig-like domain-containing protein [Chloroflexota bacterium]